MSEQNEFWNGAAGDRWVREQERLDRSIDPLGAEAIAAAAAQPGERVLDVGCGCGSTTITLASAVGSTGAVTGVDLSAPMLAHARRRAGAAGLTQVSFVQADATAFQAAQPYDLAFSRFGVMFFEDSVAAFANVRRALRPGGRLAFLCWRAIAENVWYAVPQAAVVPLAPPQEPQAPDAPGPFRFADAARVRDVLERAGFTEVRASPRDVPMRTGPLADAVDYAMATGAPARLSATVDDATRAAMRDAVREALRPYEGPTGVVLPAATWVVTARR